MMKISTIEVSLRGKMSTSMVEIFGF